MFARLHLSNSQTLLRKRLHRLLQVTFKPFACKLLDTLQRISFYSLQITLFLLMVASFDEIANEATRMVLLAMVAVVNAAVLVLFVTVIARGVMRILRRFQGTLRPM